VLTRVLNQSAHGQYLVFNVQGNFATSVASLSSLTGLQYASYATILSQAIIAHPTVLLLPSAIAGTAPTVAYPVSISIAAGVGLFFWFGEHLSRQMRRAMPSKSVLNYSACRQPSTRCL
jgi:hypothetical protein